MTVKFGRVFLAAATLIDSARKHSGCRDADCSTIAGDRTTLFDFMLVSYRGKANQHFRLQRQFLSKTLEQSIFQIKIGSNTTESLRGHREAKTGETIRDPASFED